MTDENSKGILQDIFKLGWRHSMNENLEVERPDIEKKTSWLAVASLVMGILGLFLGQMAALPALILGNLALIHIIKHPQRLKGQGLAMGGMCLSYVMIIFFSLIWVGPVIPALRMAQNQANLVHCAQQLQKIGAAISLYANDGENEKNGGVFPPQLEVLLAGENITPEMLICPGSGDKKPIMGSKEELSRRDPDPKLWTMDNEGQMCVYFPSGISYAYRGGDLSKTVPSNMIVAYDKIENHFDGRGNVLYVDGHVKLMRNEYLAEAIEKDNALRREQGLVEIPME